mmetsp:Transcript_3199/g.5493  ORF Transcript_3199/g.5493 Transcript_3199/m.5493 type:complete len:460 (+) Transcript_3199:141-1520(+)
MEIEPIRTRPSALDADLRQTPESGGTPQNTPPRRPSHAGPRDDSPGTNLTPEAPRQLIRALSVSTLPPLHAQAYRGDLAGVLGCITNMHSVHETVVMRSQRNMLLCGVTPLFLAAQRGQLDVVKLLIENGANPAQPAYIHGTAEMCTPAEVARLNFHLWTNRYLGKATRQRHKEDKVLREEETYNDTAAGNASMQGGRSMPSAAIMANLGDLTGWDPSSGAPPPLKGSQVLSMLKKNKVDLMTWRPDMERAADGKSQVVTSQSRPVDPAELASTEVVDHHDLLRNFLADADLTLWDPEGGSIAATPRKHSELGSVTTTHFPMGPSSRAGTSRNASPARVSRNASPARRAQSPGSQARATADSATRPLPSAPIGGSWNTRSQMAGARISQTANTGTRAAARAAAASAMHTKPKLPPTAATSQRWFMHGGDTDSDDEKEKDETASTSVALPPAQAAALLAA